MNPRVTPCFRLFTLCLVLLVRQAFALSLPDKPTGYVNDYASLLHDTDKQKLESDLSAFETSDSTQIIVAIFPSLDDESLEDVSMRLAEKWQIGQKGKDNGVILLIFPNDRKMRIEVGYGLEDKLTDAVSSSILRNDIAPHFKNGDFSAGVYAGVQAIKNVVQGTYAGEANGKHEDLSFFSIFLILAFIALVIYLNRNNGSRRYTHSGFSGGSWSGGSGFGGGGGGRFGGGGASGGW